MRFRSYTNKRGTIIKCFMNGTLLLLMLAGCGTVSELETETETGSSDVNAAAEQQIVEKEDADIEQLKGRCQEIALTCQGLFFDAETEEADNFSNSTLLTQAAVDSIEDKLANAGYPIMNSDSKYPSYLENAEGLSEFWNFVNHDENAQQEIITVSSYGRLYYYIFQYINGEKKYISATISWNENDELVIDEITKQSVLDWGITNEGDFYYQIIELDRHWDAYNLIRLKPVDHTLYDLNAEYIIPIGYINKNLFLVNWSDTDFSNLCFNDLFEYLYKKKTGDYFYPEGFDFHEDAYWISADLFEDTILSYFNISLNEFRAKTLYDDESETYPWQEVNVDNVSYFPTLTPEVTECRENEDGTFTLVVNVMCLDMKADPLFTHEVTIRTDGNKDFQYIANEITYTGDYELPDSKPRMSVQWER